MRGRQHHSPIRGAGDAPRSLPRHSSYASGSSSIQLVRKEASVSLWGRNGRYPMPYPMAGVSLEGGSAAWSDGASSLGFVEARRDLYAQLGSLPVKPSFALQ